MSSKYDICVIGGFGHVGLPLSIAFATKGKSVCAFDIAKDKLESIKNAKMPFLEDGAQGALEEVIKNGSLTPSLDPNDISNSENIIIVTGTPTDTHLGPELDMMKDMISSYIPYFADGQLLVLRSTVYPGTTDIIYNMIKGRGKKVDLAFCPERIAQGKAIKEIYDLPQIVSGTTPEGAKRARELFGLLTKDIITLEPKEAEVAKLFTNAWRYIKFSVANQFLMICADADLDFYKIYEAITYKYPRAADMPGAGFASGPCLFKDTVQLSAFNNHSFHIGNASILVNEGLPYYVISKLRDKHNLKEKSIGILGMAFKAGVDDKRDSLSYKLKTLLEFEAKKVSCTDVYINEEGFIKPEELVKDSDIIIVATPHKEYKTLEIGNDKIIVDIWNLYGKGVNL